MSAELLIHGWIGPIVVGQRRPSWVVTVQFDDNTALTLTGGTFTGVMKNIETGTKKTMTVGSYSITGATTGILTYAPVAADVDSAGTWIWQTKITISAVDYIVNVGIKIFEDLAA